MSFNEMFEKFKSNTASDEETRVVEEEIEKHRLVSDYITEKDEFNIDDVITSDADNSEIKSIKKTLKRRTAIIIVSAVVIVIGIAGFKINVANPIIDKQYYDPTVETLNSGVSDFTLSIEAYTELHFPGKLPAETYSVKTDVGKYSIDIYRNKWLTGEQENISATLDKNRLIVPSEFFSRHAAHAFAYSTIPFSYCGKEDFEKDKNYLATFPNYMLIQASISFDRDLTMQEIVDIQNKYSATIIWAGIRNSEREKQRYPFIGLNPTGNQYIYEKINEKYPDFVIHLSKGNKADILESHFKTLLKFQVDQKDFLNALDRDFDYYTKVSDYINENGVKSYGVVAIGRPQEILKMCQEDFVCKLYIDDIDISTCPN